MCNLLRRSRYIFHDMSISGIERCGHVCPALNCLNLLCVFNLKCMQGRERAPGWPYASPLSFAEPLEWFTTSVNSWRRAVKSDGGVFNQARGSPRLIPGQLAPSRKVAVLAQCREFDGPLFARLASPCDGSVSLDQGAVVSVSNARILMQILSLYADQSSQAQKVLFCRGRCRRPQAQNACQDRASGPIRVMLEDFMVGLKCNFLCNTRHTSSCVFCQNDMTPRLSRTCTRNPTRLQAVRLPLCRPLLSLLWQGNHPLGF